MIIHPGTDGRSMRRAAVLYEVEPDGVCRQVSGPDNIYWLHDRDRGVILGWNADQDTVVIRRWIPVTCGTVTASASSVAS
jgi:hypothetical protein